MPSQPPSNPSEQPSSRRERRELERASTPRVRARTAPKKKAPAWQNPIVLISVVAVAAIAVVLVLIQKPAATTADIQAPPAQAAGIAAASLADGEELGKPDEIGRAHV